MSGPCPRCCCARTAHISLLPTRIGIYSCFDMLLTLFLRFVGGDYHNRYLDAMILVIILYASCAGEVLAA